MLLLLLKLSEDSSDFLGSWINGNTFIISPLSSFTSDFLGSWINGNPTTLSGLSRWTSDFLGSWINGNNGFCLLWAFGVLLTSSEVELMETFLNCDSAWSINSSDFLGSWINGNLLLRRSISSSTTSDFLGSWINGNFKLIDVVEIFFTYVFWLPRKLN